MGFRRVFRLVVGASMLVVGLGPSIVAGGPTGADSATIAPVPSYSATGVCVAGAPQFAFSFVGFPTGQHTSVNLFLYDQPDATGTQTATVGPSGTATVLWDTSSPLFGPGPHVIAAAVGSTGLPARNLTPVAPWPIPDSYAVTLPHCGAGAWSPVGLVGTPDGQGYWQVTTDGQVLAFGDARWFGSMSGAHLDHPIVGIAPTPTGLGYWLVASDGGVFSFGDAPFYGSMGGSDLNEPVVGMAGSSDGRGYTLVASDGGVFSFGDARFAGSMGGTRLNQGVVGMAVDPGTGGYWLVGADGGVFAFGAPFLGSTGAIRLNRPVVGMETGTGTGYRLVADDGGVFTFGTSAFFGSLGGAPPSHAVLGIAPAPADQGYTLLDSGGGIHPFGSGEDEGSLAGAVTLR